MEYNGGRGKKKKYNIKSEKNMTQKNVVCQTWNPEGILMREITKVQKKKMTSSDSLKNDNYFYEIFFFEIVLIFL